jgi:SAM-dependent methyltransferase
MLSPVWQGSRKVPALDMTEDQPKSVGLGTSSTPAALTFWERVATTRWGQYVSAVEQRVILQATAVLAKPSQALEIGCDGGRWSKMLADLGWQMTCVDVNPETLPICRQRVPSARCVLSDAQTEVIPCESESMDLLLCVEVGAVINSRWFLPEAHRVLRGNGVLVGICWNRASLRGVLSRLNERLAPISNTVFYSRPYSGWKADLGRAGFEMVHEEGLCWSFFGRKSNSPLIPFCTRLERRLQLHRLTSLSPWIVFIARKGAGRVSN